MRRAVLFVLPLLVVLAVALWRAEGPPPKTAAAPASDFSAGRAMQTLREILVEGVPHPVGTPANRRVRARIETRFRTLGYETVVQRRFACNSGAVCATVENVIARRPGAPRAGTVLLMAHYDSVAAGPGAGDDGLGVATLLEIARATRNENFPNPVAFLVTDGEETGLLGAEAFVRDAKDIGIVINIDNRGTHGASTLFETSTGNRWIVRQLANALERPQASSVFYTVYTLLPNDTDVSVFKRAGIAAANFAAIRGVEHYHTPQDNLANVSARTLQHHGDNALAALRAFANSDLDARSATDAVYFDVLGLAMIWWPAEWTLWIAILSLVALLIGARKSDPRAMTFGVLATFTAVLIASVAGAAMGLLVNAKTGGLNFVAHSAPGIAAMWLVGIAAALLAAAIFHRRDDDRAMLYGVAIVWHMVAIALALTLGGLAYLFLLPAVAITLCAWTDAGETATSLVAATIAAILMFPFAAMLYEALGARLMTAIAVLVGTFATLVAPLFARSRNGAAALLLAIAFGLIAMVQPPATPAHRRPQTVSYVDDPNAPAPFFTTSAVSDELRAVAKFGKTNMALTPWDGGQSWATPAPRLGLERVAVSGTRNGNLVTVQVRSPRHANRIALLVKGGTVRRVNGVAPPPGRHRFRSFRGWHYAAVYGLDAMTVEIVANGPVEIVASDATFGLPPSGAVLARARDASNATAFQDGDLTLTRARAKL